MKNIQELGNVDIYVIDQLLKGAIQSNHRILDAGCGSGRNFCYLAKHNFNITGIDPNEEHIQILKNQFPEYNKNLFRSSIEDFEPTTSFNYIICNAVLHFAKDHDHFNTLFSKLVALLANEGTLFIRMTTNHGLSNLPNGNSGVHLLPDLSMRYLITREIVSELCQQHSLSLKEPFKTVLVENYRSMATIILKKNEVY